MPLGKIKSLFKTGKKNLAIIEYNNGRNLIYYHALNNNLYATPLSLGDKVTFNIKSGDSGMEAGNVFRIIH